MGENFENTNIQGEGQLAQDTEPQPETDIADEGTPSADTYEEAAADSLAVNANSVASSSTLGKKIKLTKDETKQLTKHILILVFLACFRSITTYMFTIPNGFAPGGLGGISSIIYNAVVLVTDEGSVLRTVFDPGLMMFIMNIPFIIAAGIVLNKKFALSTFGIVSIYSVLMFVLRVVGCPQFDVSDHEGLKILAALAGGATAGFGLGIMLRHNMSMGGTDIVGKILHKKNPDTSAQRWILLCDCIVATCSGILGIINVVGKGMEPSEAVVAVLSPIFFSFVSLVFGSITTDIVQAGFLSSAVINIITDKPDDISTAISERLHRGVTMSTAIGCYTKVEHKVLTCVVRKRQISAVKKIIEEVDPLAFTYIVKAHEVAGKGFHSAG